MTLSYRSSLPSHFLIVSPSSLPPYGLLYYYLPTLLFPPPSLFLLSVPPSLLSHPPLSPPQSTHNEKARCLHSCNAKGQRSPDYLGRWSNMRQCPGQFIGFRAKVSFSISIWNMFSCLGGVKKVRRHTFVHPHHTHTDRQTDTHLRSSAANVLTSATVCCCRDLEK